MHTTQAGSVARPKLPPALLTEDGRPKLATSEGIDAWRGLRGRCPIEEIDRFVYSEANRGKFWTVGKAAK